VRACLALAGLLGALGSLDGLPAQTEFDRLFAKAEAIDKASAAVRQRAYLTAFDAFSRLQLDSAEYRRALPRGAVSALHGGRFADAAELLELDWRRAGPSAVLLTRRLRALAGAGQARAAVQLARQHESVHAGGVRAWIGDLTTLAGRLADADQLLLQGNTSEGLWMFETLAQVHPGESTLCANLALTNRRLGRLDRAAAGYRVALNLSPSAAWLWTDYGLLLKGQGQPEAAAKAFISGLSKESRPGLSPAGTNLGVLSVRTGDSRGRDPVADVTAVLRARPKARMAQRVLLDLLARKGR